MRYVGMADSFPRRADQNWSKSPQSPCHTWLSDKYYLFLWLMCFEGWHQFNNQIISIPQLAMMSPQDLTKLLQWRNILPPEEPQ